MPKLAPRRRLLSSDTRTHSRDTITGLSGGRYHGRSDGRLSRSRRENSRDSVVGIDTSDRSVDKHSPSSLALQETTVDLGPGPGSVESGTTPTPILGRTRRPRRTKVPTAALQGSGGLSSGGTCDVIEGFLATNRPECIKCGLFQTCKAPVMRAGPRRGEGWTGEFAVIGEAPGSNEDTEGRAFIGES